MQQSLAGRVLVIIACVTATTISISAQRLLQSSSEKDLMLAVGVDIEQCANGPRTAPIPCNTAGANEGYGRGNLVSSKSHYFEGDSVPIRVVGTGLTVGQTYTLTVGYDYTKAGKYASDYLTSYDRTESVNNNPCVGVAGCSLASKADFAIPADPQVALGYDGVVSGDDITQIPGNFSCFGCTITGTSVYGLIGATTGDSSKFIEITLTANQASAVVAYGSHISRRADWGLLNSAINISGSPYHNFVLEFPDSNNGNRDLQLSAEAVIFPAFIIIEKTVVALGAATSSSFSFGFTSSAALFPGTSFSLVDNIAEPLPDTNVGGTIQSIGITNFGADNLITVTENNYAPVWTLASIGCQSVGGTVNDTISLAGRNVAIQLEEGEIVKCTFNNTQLIPTAAPASISGRVVTSFGQGISGARITVMDAQSGNTFYATTNSFGFYTVQGPEVGNFYVMSVSSKRYTFADDTRTFSLTDSIAGVDWIANP